jgi:hypothetical protein
VGHSPKSIVRVCTMGNLALITVSITYTGTDITIAIGGPPDQARNMRSRLAEKMNLVCPIGDRMLDLELDWEVVETFIKPILAEFPGIGWCYADVLEAHSQNVPPGTSEMIH